MTNVRLRVCLWKIEQLGGLLKRQVKKSKKIHSVLLECVMPKCSDVLSEYTHHASTLTYRGVSYNVVDMINDDNDKDGLEVVIDGGEKSHLLLQSIIQQPLNFRIVELYGKSETCIGTFSVDVVSLLTQSSVECCVEIDKGISVRVVADLEECTIDKSTLAVANFRLNDITCIPDEWTTEDDSVFLQSQWPKITDADQLCTFVHTLSMTNDEEPNVIRLVYEAKVLERILSQPLPMILGSTNSEQHAVGYANLRSLLKPGATQCVNMHTNLHWCATQKWTPTKVSWSMSVPHECRPCLVPPPLSAVVSLPIVASMTAGNSEFDERNENEVVTSVHSVIDSAAKLVEKYAAKATNGDLACHMLEDANVYHSLCDDMSAALKLIGCDNIDECRAFVLAVYNEYRTKQSQESGCNVVHSLLATAAAALEEREYNKSEQCVLDALVALNDSESHPAKNDCWYMYGVLMMYKGEHVDAVTCFEQMNTTDIRGVIARICWLLHKDQVEDAEPLVHQLTQLVVTIENQQWKALGYCVCGLFSLMFDEIEKCVEFGRLATELLPDMYRPQHSSEDTMPYVYLASFLCRELHLSQLAQRLCARELNERNTNVHHHDIQIVLTECCALEVSEKQAFHELQEYARTHVLEESSDAYATQVKASVYCTLGELCSSDSQQAAAYFQFAHECHPTLASARGLAMHTCSPSFYTQLCTTDEPTRIMWPWPSVAPPARDHHSNWIGLARVLQDNPATKTAALVATNKASRLTFGRYVDDQQQSQKPR